MVAKVNFLVAFGKIATVYFEPYLPSMHALLHPITLLPSLHLCILEPVTPYVLSTGCCLQAKCCPDHLHCCAADEECDVAAGECRKPGAPFSVPMQRKLAARPLRADDDIQCPDNISTCPAGTTCCEMQSGYYGCCPIPNVSRLMSSSRRNVSEKFVLGKVTIQVQLKKWFSAMGL
jgi:hypothetical protein